MNSYKLTFYKNLNFSEVLFILIPIFLIGSGPFMSNLAISMIALIFIFKIFFKNLYIEPSKYFYFSITCFIILITSALTSDYALSSFVKSLAYLRFLIFPIAISYLLRDNKNLYLYFYNILFFSILIVTIDGLIQFFLGYNSIGLILNLFDFKENPYRLLMGYKVQGLFADEGILGSYLSRLFPIFVGLSIYLKKTNNKIFYLIYFFISVNILISGERVALILFIMSNFLLLLFISELRVKLLKILSFIVIIYFLVISFNVKVYDRMINSTLNSVVKFNEAKGIDYFILSKEHEPLIFSATKIFKNNFLLGAGPTNFRRACNKKENFILDKNSNTLKKVCSTHPHNYYFQILAEVGIIGFLFYSSCIIYFFSKIIYNKNRIPNYVKCMIIAIILSIFPFIVTGNFFNSWLSCIHFLPIPFILNYFQKGKINVQR